MISWYDSIVYARFTLYVKNNINLQIIRWILQQKMEIQRVYIKFQLDLISVSRIMILTVQKTCSIEKLSYVPQQS